MGSRMDAVALFDAPPEAEVARRLLAYLRAGGASGTDFAVLPSRMLGGFDTLVYAFALRDPPPELAGPLVLRVYRDAQGPQRARREASLQNGVGALGFPIPRVLLTCADRGVLGGAFLVMQRIPGRVMLDAFFGPRVLAMPGLLAALQARLHGLDAEALRRRLDADGTAAAELSVSADLAAMQEQAAAAQLAGLAPGLEWLRAHRPAPPVRLAICHGDFHPLNILLEGRRVSGVLDWAWSKIDDPAWDVGATVALMTQGPLALPGVLQGVAAAARRWLVARYLRAYAAVRPIDLTAVRFYEALRCVGMLLEAGVHRQAARGVIPPVAKPCAFDTPRAVRDLATRFRAVSAVGVTVPD